MTDHYPPRMIAMLEAICGTKLKFRVRGADAERALTAIATLFEANFGEEE